MRIDLFSLVCLSVAALVCCDASSPESRCGTESCVDQCRDRGYRAGACDDGLCVCGEDVEHLEPSGPCDGACGRLEYNECTCGETDPCGWRDDGYCDLDTCIELDGPVFIDTNDCDEDDDGIPQVVEFMVAQIFAPILIFAEGEDDSGRLSHWALERLGESQITIFYALGYFRDGGDPWAELFTWHYGDTEFIVLEITVDDESLFIENVFLSAHFGQDAWDSSEWVWGEDLEYDDSDGGLHPYIWVSEGKHANYRSSGACDLGALSADRCSVGGIEDVQVLRERNLGNDQVPLIDEVEIDGASEFFWSHSDIPFCGWQISSLSAFLRDPCVPATNSYARELGHWLDGTLF